MVNLHNKVESGREINIVQVFKYLGKKDKSFTNSETGEVLKWSVISVFGSRENDDIVSPAYHEFTCNSNADLSFMIPDMFYKFGLQVGEKNKIRIVAIYDYDLGDSAFI